jgi:hypothetical protein
MIACYSLAEVSGRAKSHTWETFMNRGSFFWGLTFIAIINVFLVIVSAVHHTDLWVRLPLLTILLSVVIIWAASARLQNGLYKVRSEADEEAVLRLQSVAQTMAFIANLAILSALPLLH